MKYFLATGVLALSVLTAYSEIIPSFAQEDPFTSPTDRMPPTAPVASPLPLQSPQHTQVTFADSLHPATTPSLTVLGDKQLRLWWHYTVLEPFPDAPEQKRIAYGTVAVGSALWSGKKFKLVSRYPKTQQNWPTTLQLPDPEGTVRSNLAAQMRFYAVPHSPDAVMVVPVASDSHQSFDTNIVLLPRAKDTLVTSKIAPSQRSLPEVLNKPYAGLPNNIPAPRPKAFGSSEPFTAMTTLEELEARGNTTDVSDLTDMEYLHPSLSIAPDGRRWFLAARTGETKDYQMLFTSSQDAGKTWVMPALLGFGFDPALERTARGDLLLFFGTDTVRSRDLAKSPALLMRRSTDNGTTWSSPLALVNDPLCGPSQVCHGPDGRLWVVYQRNDDLDVLQTSLWLLSSSDEGRSWTAPFRLTEGTGYNGQPAITVFRDRVIVAYARRKQSDPANIWVATVKFPRYK